MKFFPLAITALVLFIGQTPSEASEPACDRLSSAYTERAALTLEQRESLVANLKKEVLLGGLCAKNLLGRVLYDGDIIARDLDRAHAIFYDLSEQSYPPAMYNLAYLSVSEFKDSPSQVLAFIHGLMIRFSSDPKWVRISANARELGYEYIDLLQKRGKVSDSEKDALFSLHQQIATRNVSELAQAILTRDRAVRDFNQGVTNVLSIAVAIYSIASVATAAGATIGPRCDYFSCKPYMSTGDLYNAGILR